MKLEKIDQLARGCFVGYGGEKEFLKLCWKSRSRSKVDYWLVRAVDDNKNEDTCACQ